MSRRRWIVLLGPPLLLAAAVPALSDRTAVRVGATSLLPPLPIAACPNPASSAPGRAAAVPGAWWRTAPVLDGAGALEGWTVLVGGPDGRAASLEIPAASTVTGPTGGRVVVVSEGDLRGPGSLVRVVDATVGCATDIRLRDHVARRAVVDPAGPGVLAHLLEPATRRDLGVWRIGLDGRIGERLVEPLPAALREAAGIDRVWTTDLRLDAAGGRLAVQSCNPDACVSRVADLGTGDLAVLATEAHGAGVGFAGTELVAWAACHGLPCAVVAWDIASGSMRTLATDASGATLAADGRHLVVLRREAGGERELVAIDLSTRAWRSLGQAGVDAVPLTGGAGMVAGLETAGATVAIGHAGRIPVALGLAVDGAATPPDREVLP
jgi:hypothetical protein